ncbi:two-component regulator propeller domain-containing protein [Emticicia sp. SJ17W-69]|uniref:sensor histidine kinase n=1 Tax=Emticicia sp. SJ17W-69 TaxID=3421657 RepID=UPI003EC1099D
MKKTHKTIKVLSPIFSTRIFTINYKFILSFFILHYSLYTPKIFAQSARLPYTFDQMKVSNSSLSNTITCMLKDQNGYLWLGTASGLKRYDSGFTTTFKHKKGDDKSLIHNFIESLCEDKQGRIWIGTTEGICYFDKKKNLFFPFKELNKPDYACLNIICDSRGDIWFSIRDKGLYRFNTKTNQLDNFSHDFAKPKRLTSNRVFRKGLIEDPHKSGIWISCSEVLNFFDFSTQSIYNHEFNPKKIEILNLPTVAALTTNENKLIFVDNNTEEIIWYDTKLQKKVKTFSLTTNPNVSLSGVYQLFFDSNKHIWVSTFEKKMAYIDLQKKQIIPIEYERGNSISFSAYHFLDVFQEKNGTIWFATPNGISTVNGLAALTPNEKLFDIYDFSKKMFKNHSNDGFLDLEEDNKDSSWWMLTFENRLIKYLPSTNQHVEYKIPLSQKSTHDFNYAIFLDGYQDNIIITKPYAIFTFNKSTKRFSELEIPKKISVENVSSITHTKLLGDSIWIFGKDLYEVYNYHFKRKQWKTYPLILNAENRKKASQRWHFAPTESLFTRSGEFWIDIQAGGLAKFSKEKQAFIGIKTKQDIDFSKIGFSGFIEDKNGKFWLGSYDLIKFDPITNDFQSAMDTDFIGSMSIDENDNICISALDEVMFFNEKKNDKYSFTFPTNEPLSDWGNRLINLKNNKIISLGKQVLALIEFKNLKIPSFQDQLYINRISNADTAILINENNSQVNFDSKQNTFSIYFGILAPPNTDMYEISYQLVGFDKNWIADKENKKVAVYGHLDGGDYIFKVRAKDINQNYLPTQTLSIHIETIFYNTLWFRILCFLAIVGIVFAFFRYRTNQRKQIHHLQIQSTRLAKDKTEIQYQNLINHLNPHFLFNSLTSLNGLILSEPDVASDFLQKLSKIYRYILQNKENEVVSLEQELAFVKNYIDLQKSRFEDGLQVNINIDEDYLSSGIVPVTLQNLFENAIKHNTVEEDKPLIINIFIEDEYLIVKNNLQKKKFVETSNKQGLDSLKSLYKYLTSNPLETIETETEFIVKIPLL